MKFVEWRLAMLIANDLANLLESEPGQEDAVLFLHASVLLSFYKTFIALGLNDRARWLTPRVESQQPPQCP